MKSSRNGVIIVLIISSLTLLLVLQVFWLRSSFQDEWQRTHKEASMLFRNTVFDLTDSLLEKSISAIPAGGFPQMRIQVRDSVKIISSPTKLKRSSITI
ncbi:MAG: hypothetical protein K2U26_04745, partial [Cyclobacteriaceae bacterium]|nr:hypothetical protein [Cyclobacteriaceae bacterium]